MFFLYLQFKHRPRFKCQDRLFCTSNFIILAVDIMALVFSMELVFNLIGEYNTSSFIYMSDGAPQVCDYDSCQKCCDKGCARFREVRFALIVIIITCLHVDLSG